MITHEEAVNYLLNDRFKSWGYDEEDEYGNMAVGMVMQMLYDPDEGYGARIDAYGRIFTGGSMLHFSSERVGYVTLEDIKTLANDFEEGTGYFYSEEED